MQEIHSGLDVSTKHDLSWSFSSSSMHGEYSDSAAGSYRGSSVELPCVSESMF